MSELLTEMVHNRWKVLYRRVAIKRLNAYFQC